MLYKALIMTYTVHYTACICNVMLLCSVIVLRTLYILPVGSSVPSGVTRVGNLVLSQFRLLPKTTSRKNHATFHDIRHA